MTNDDDDGLLVSIYHFLFFISLTDCKKEHSRLLSITCHSLALHILVFCWTIWNFFGQVFFFSQYSRSPLSMICACRPSPLCSSFPFCLLISRYVSRSYSCIPFAYLLNGQLSRLPIPTDHFCRHDKAMFLLCLIICSNTVSYKRDDPV